MNDNVILQASAIKKVYGGITALDSVDFELRAGEIHGLCGENGAGKSTLVKILGGLVKPEGGRISVNGESLKLGRRTPPDLISLVHQELSIIPDLSVLDNVLLGSEEVGAVYLRRRFEQRVRTQLGAMGLAHVDLYQPASELSLAELQLIEIARGVARGARVLILDEPTATLSDGEIQRVFEAVRWLRDQGTTIVFISHRLAEVFEITDRITVFRSGRRVDTRPTREYDARGLVKAMIGREIKPRTMSPPPPRRPGTERLGLRRLSIDDRVGPLNVSVAPGEIVGMVGQLGSGADAIVEALTGLRRYTGGIYVDGNRVTMVSPNDAIRSGIAYVAEDRAGKGVFLDATVSTNISSSILGRMSRFGLVQSRTERTTTRRLADQFALDPARLDTPTADLSGGNQQKVAMAKAAALEPSVMLLNEPTRGVDIGARAEIYRRLREMAERGLSVVFFSTDFEEVLELADRVITIFRGDIVNDLPIAQVNMNGMVHDILHGPESEQEAV